jgi:hypothetical protein
MSVSIFSIPKKWLLPNHGLTLTFAKKNPNPAGRIQVVGWLVQAPHGIFTSEKGTERRHTLSKNPNGLKVFIEFFHLGRTCLDQFFFQAKLLGLGSARFGSGAAVMTQRS